MSNFSTGQNTEFRTPVEDPELHYLTGHSQYENGCCNSKRIGSRRSSVRAQPWIALSCVVSRVRRRRDESFSCHRNCAPARRIFAHVAVVESSRRAVPDLNGTKEAREGWVIPSSRIRTGHVAGIDPLHGGIGKAGGVNSWFHGLRNAFNTGAERDLMLPRSLSGWLVNHARPSDVTEIYAADWTVEHLREPTQRIAGRIDALMMVDAGHQGPTTIKTRTAGLQSIHAPNSPASSSCADRDVQTYRLESRALSAHRNDIGG